VLKKILIAAVVVVVAFAAFVATRPGSFRVERSIAVAAPAEKVFPLVADLRKMDEWSPWEKRDPNSKKVYSGEGGQVGSSYRWAGNKEVGEGQMTVTEAVPPTRVTFRLEFFEPYQSVATAAFALVPDGARTKVSWSMEGKLGFMEKAVGLFMDMEGMIAKDFDEGLASLKVLAERVEAPEEVAPTPTGG